LKEKIEEETSFLANGAMTLTSKTKNFTFAGSDKYSSLDKTLTSG
jgi:hypothetical protein